LVNSTSRIKTPEGEETPKLARNLSWSQDGLSLLNLLGYFVQKLMINSLL
jgi:hypothetical protein